NATLLTCTLSPRVGSSPTALPTSCWMLAVFTPDFPASSTTATVSRLTLPGAACALVTTVPTALSTVRSDLVYLPPPFAPDVAVRVGQVWPRAPPAPPA